MRKIAFLLLLIPIFFTGCKKKSACVPDAYLNVFYNNARVDTISNGSSLRAFTTSGNRVVFSYLHAHSGCQGYIDEGVSYQLLFEADPEATQIMLYENDLAAAHCYFTYSTNGNGSLGAYIPSGGTIEGSRIDGKHWKIYINLKLKNETLTSSNIYTMQ